MLNAGFDFRRWGEAGILLAVSGGADSVAMLRYFAEHCGQPVRAAVAHVNHGLRGEESDRDAFFVAQLSETLGFPYVECRLTQEDFARQPTGSWESAARDLRYDFLSRQAETLGFRYVATAHTQDDQVETVLHRILRGTGIAGIAGIPPFRQLTGAVTLVRPFLSVSKEEILDYLSKIAQPFRVDSSNASFDFIRNKIRNILLPTLRKEYNSHVDSVLLRLARQAENCSEYITRQVQALFENCVRFLNSGEVEIRTDKIKGFPRFLICELFILVWKQKKWPLQEMGFEQWNLLAGIPDRVDDFKQVFPGAVEVEYLISEQCIIIRNKTHRK
ncbi:MAG: tRNA lysidine(34) synthetase TilS [Planctomycetaceae bacterium]|jgi:tRNA(Ile)-lysidine synthase|nr:tRNA lysidine(34) synthetase TilS [Planctomycetaceae bacterium]